MPRGLGDDPLSRKRRKGTSQTTVVQLDEVSPAVGANPLDDSSSSSQYALNEPAAGAAPILAASSYNDVFFQRKTGDAENEGVVAYSTNESAPVETIAPAATVDQVNYDVAGSPSPIVVTESSVAIVDSPSAPAVESSETLLDSPSVAIVDSPSPTVVDSSPAIVETPSIAAPESSPAITAPHSPDALVESSTAVSSRAPEKETEEDLHGAVATEVGRPDSPGDDAQDEPEAQKGGFFKRIFGRFGK